jgi:hypothetical protein
MNSLKDGREDPEGPIPIRTNFGRDTSFSVTAQAKASGSLDRITELEMENSRLHRLVAELLLKNQQLRKAD